MQREHPRGHGIDYYNRLVMYRSCTARLECENMGYKSYTCGNRCDSNTVASKSSLITYVGCI